MKQVAGMVAMAALVGVNVGCSVLVGVGLGAGCGLVGVAWGLGGLEVTNGSSRRGAGVGVCRRSAVGDDVGVGRAAAACTDKAGKNTSTDRISSSAARWRRCC